MDRQRPRRPPIPRVAFIGAGRAARALAAALHTAGVPVVSVSSRSPSSAEALARTIPGCRVGAPDDAELVLLTVPDGAIAEVAAAFSWRPGQFVVHCAGALGREALETASNAEAVIGVWHPLQSLARPAQDFRGVRFAIDAEPPLDETLRTLTEVIGGVPLPIPAGGHAIYHLGATLVANYAVALVALAADLWETIGIDRASATGALAPLLAGTAANLAEIGLPDALTGPIARGDVATVDRHLTTLGALRPQLIPLYRALGMAALKLAVERELPVERTEALQQRLDPHNLTTKAVAGGM
ncbi:MAG: hypothetical protein KatS3mg060_3061 [Dehalococcoidia bacterium]|nr:MAG: hypothetical protein KatS3mg060_3061 [Dehalococcoidia bacterium]